MAPSLWRSPAASSALGRAAGVGTYTAKFHHLAELTGRLADNVLAAHKQAAE
jgi:hypothetical protein